MRFAKVFRGNPVLSFSFLISSVFLAAQLLPAIAAAADRGRGVPSRNAQERFVRRQLDGLIKRRGEVVVDWARKSRDVKEGAEDNGDLGGLKVILGLGPKLNQRVSNLRPDNIFLRVIDFRDIDNFQAGAIPSDAPFGLATILAPPIDDFLATLGGDLVLIAYAQTLGDAYAADLAPIPGSNCPDDVDPNNPCEDPPLTSAQYQEAVNMLQALLGRYQSELTVARAREAEIPPLIAADEAELARVNARIDEINNVLLPPLQAAWTAADNERIRLQGLLDAENAKPFPGPDPVVVAALQGQIDIQVAEITRLDGLINPLVTERDALLIQRQVLIDRIAALRLELEKLRRVFIPFTEGKIQQVTQLLGESQTNLADAIRDEQDAVDDGLGDLGDIVVDMTEAIGRLQGLADRVGDFVQDWGGVLDLIFDTNLADGLPDLGQTALQGTIDRTKAKIEELGVKAQDTYKKFQSFTLILDIVKQVACGAVADIVTSVISFIPPLKDLLNGAIRGIMGCGGGGPAPALGGDFSVAAARKVVRSAQACSGPKDSKKRIKCEKNTREAWNLFKKAVKKGTNESIAAAETELLEVSRRHLGGRSFAEVMAGYQDRSNQLAQ